MDSPLKFNNPPQNFKTLNIIKKTDEKMIMIKKLYLLSFALIFLFSCNQSSDTSKPEEKNNDVSEERSKIEFTPFIISEVFLYDTNEIKTVGRGEVINGVWYPTGTVLGYNSNYIQMSAKQMQTFIQNLIHSKNARVYLDIDSNKLSTWEVSAMANSCDSIIELDDKGKEINRHFICDSTLMYNGIQKIIFYETWNLNPDNGSIDKEVLGYTLCQKLEGDEGFMGKDKYRSVFHIFNDEAKLEKVKKYLYIKSKRTGKD